jgi:hypothetical protein
LVAFARPVAGGADAMSISIAAELLMIYIYILGFALSDFAP